MISLIDQLNYTPLIIPTVLIPFTLVSVGISVVATFIAGLFGIELKAEGPKQLLEVLLRPKVIITAIILNVVGLASFRAYIYIKNSPAFMHTINSKSKNVSSSKTYSKMTQDIYSYSLSNKKFTPENFNLVWETKLSSSAFRLGTINKDSLFIAQTNGEISEVELKTGSVFRQFFIGTMIAPNPTIRDGFLYTGEGSHDTHMARAYKIDLSTGKHIKQFQTKGHIEGQIKFAKQSGKELLFVPSGKDGFYAIDPATMEKVWHKNPGHIDASVNIRDGIVYVATGREKGDAKKYRTFVAAYDFMTGQQLWKNETPLSSWMAPVVKEKVVCFIFGEVYFASNLGQLNCYDRWSGESHLSVSFNNPLIGQPLIIDHLIIVSDLFGKVCAVDTVKKVKKWCNNQASSLTPVMNTPSYSKHKGLIGYASPKKGVFFIDPQNGQTVSRYHPNDWRPSSLANIIFLKDGFLSIGNRGYLRKVRW